MVASVALNRVLAVGKWASVRELAEQMGTRNGITDYCVSKKCSAAGDDLMVATDETKCDNSAEK
jgi:hypothetical protein